MTHYDAGKGAPACGARMSVGRRPEVDSVVARVGCERCLKIARKALPAPPTFADRIAKVDSLLAKLRAEAPDRYVAFVEDALRERMMRRLVGG